MKKLHDKTHVSASHFCKKKMRPLIKVQWYSYHARDIW